MRRRKGFSFNAILNNDAAREQYVVEMRELLSAFTPEMVEEMMLTMQAQIQVDAVGDFPLHDFTAHLLGGALPQELNQGEETAAVYQAFLVHGAMVVPSKLEWENYAESKAYALLLAEVFQDSWVSDYINSLR